MIEIKHLGKTFLSSAGEVTALDDINLTINDGEIFGIIGLSGAGKSTLVRCINLLEKPTCGEVIIDGNEMTMLTKKELLKMRQSIGMIFQNFNLLAQRNLLKNVCFPLEIAGVKKEEAEKRAIELLKIVGLEERKYDYPSQLSGGQKQRVAIARALATNPKYLLCDEATSALDPNTTQSILDLLKEINGKFGVTIIVITHEMKVIDQICDKVAVIDKSHIAEIGNVAEVFVNPQSDIAKELIFPSTPLTKKTKTTGKQVRLIFDGESFDRPIVSNMIMACKAEISIIYADTKDINGKTYGNTIFELPDSKETADKVIKWLDENKIKYAIEGELH